LGPLRAYLLAKLLWNPKTDLQKHSAEFLAAYYGNTAPQIRAYLDLLENQVRDGKAHAHIFDRSAVAYLNDGFLDSADKTLDEAETAVDTDAVRFRVQVTRLPIWYVKLATKRLEGPARSERLERFLTIARKAAISNISESQSLEEWAKKQ
jgi:hypothetical protein